MVSGQAGFINPTNALIITSTFHVASSTLWCPCLGCGPVQTCPWHRSLATWYCNVAELSSRTYLKVHG